LDRDVAIIANAKDIGAQLRKMREAAGLSREQVAVYMGKSVSSLVRWETNQKVPTIMEARRFALVLKRGGAIPSNWPKARNLSSPQGAYSFWPIPRADEDIRLPIPA
jgi:transcriptional regulator with XRE-family HTH domain